MTPATDIRETICREFGNGGAANRQAVIASSNWADDWKLLPDTDAIQRLAKIIRDMASEESSQ